MSHYCSPCGVWYPTERAWNLHFPATNHAPKYSCNSCEYTTYYFNPKALEQHTKDVHLPPNYCSECDRSFLNDSFLQQHKKLVHVPSVYCSECNRYFKTDSALSQHLRGRAHASAEMAPRVAASRLYCETCARKFVNKQAMTQHMASQSHNRAVRKSSRQSSPAPSTHSTRPPALIERVAPAPSSLHAPLVSDSRRSSIASMDDGVSLTAADDNNLAKPLQEVEPTATAVASASIRSLNLPSTPPPEEFEETVKTPVTVLHIDIPQTPEETQTTTLTPATSVSSRSGDAVEDPFGDKMPDEPASAGTVRAEVARVVAEEVEVPSVPSTLNVINAPKDVEEERVEEEEEEEVPVVSEEVKNSPTLEFVEAPEEPETVEAPVVIAPEVRLDMEAEEGVEEQLKREDIREQLKGEEEEEEDEEEEEEEDEWAEEEGEPAAPLVVPNEAVPELSIEPEGVRDPSEESVPSTIEAHTLPEESVPSTIEAHTLPEESVPESVPSTIEAHTLPEEKVQSPEATIPEPTIAEAIVSKAIITETPIPEAPIAKVEVLPTPVPIPETAEEEPVTVTKSIIAEPTVTVVAEQTIATPEPVILEATAPSKLDAIRTPLPSPSNPSDPSTPPPTTPPLNLDLVSSPTPSTAAKEERPHAPRAITQTLISTPAPTSTVEPVTASASRSATICPQCPATSGTLYENSDQLTAHIDSAHGKNAKDGKDGKDSGKEKRGLVKGLGRFWGMGLRKFKFLA